jgi:putative component of membrane protein insertase Oxa1/YidC/SpoIIIJ protein YidD
MGDRFSVAAERNRPGHAAVTPWSRVRSLCRLWLRLGWVGAGTVIALMAGGQCFAATGSLMNDLGRLDEYSSMLSRSGDATLAATSSSAERTPLVPGVGTAFRSLIALYQLTLSSQDSPACNYEPTCSRFAQEAIEARGPVLGSLMTSDRLQRCIGAARKYYPPDPMTFRALDPVRPSLHSAR